MELETDDPVKSKLLKRSSKYREDLEDEAKLISDRTEKIIKNALIVGGSLALAYILYNQLSGTKKKKKAQVKKAKPVQAAVAETEESDEVEETTSMPNKIISQIGTALVSQASVFLLAMAKEKLSEYLQAQAEKKKDEHT